MKEVICVEKTFKIGVSREIITPPIGTCLFGYRPNWKSESVHDDLTVTAIALESETEKALLISATVCLIQNELCSYLRKKIEKETGVPFENIIISATHTHSAPNTAGMKGWGEIDTEYCEKIFNVQMTKAAKSAFENMTDAKMGVATTHSDVGINRREINLDGSIALGQNPWGPYDPTMTIIAFKSLDDKPLANLIHYSAHGTAAGCNREISRDWSGVMTDRLEKESGAITAFFNGAEGDVGPRLSNGLTVGDISHVIEIGSVAAIDAVRGYKKIKSYSVPALSLIKGEIKLPYSPLMSKEDALEAISTYENPEELINISYLEYHRLKSILEVYEKNEPVKTHNIFKQTIVKIDDVVFLPIAYEFFVEIALRLRKESPYQYTLSLSNANGSNSYLASQSEICKGGYEIRSFLSGNTYNLTPDADTLIVNENIKLLTQNN